MWRGGDDWFHVHLARSVHWDSFPYDYGPGGTDHANGTIFPGFDSHGIEDPFIYRQPMPWVSSSSSASTLSSAAASAAASPSRSAPATSMATTANTTAVVAYTNGTYRGCYIGQVFGPGFVSFDECGGAPGSFKCALSDNASDACSATYCSGGHSHKGCACTNCTLAPPRPQTRFTCACVEDCECTNARSRSSPPDTTPDTTADTTADTSADTTAYSYHAIFHDHSTFGGHAFSRDGASWTYSTVVPFNNTVVYTDQSRVDLQRRERPHLIFDSKGFITHLTNGVQPPPNPPAHAPPSPLFQNDYTYTLVQPVAPQTAQGGWGKTTQ